MGLSAISVRGETAGLRLRKALERDPSSLAFVGLAGLHLIAQEWDETIKLCEGGLGHHPNHSTGHLLLGIALSETGREDDATREFREVLRLDPGNRMARQRVGGVRGKPADEKEEVEIDVEKEVAFLTYTMAEVYEKQGFFEKALSIYQRVLDLQPRKEDVPERIRRLREMVGQV